MKKLLIILVFLIPSSAMFAQKIAPTTEEEYNMGAVGYKMFLSLHVEMKKGYQIKDMNSFEYAERKADFKGIYRSGETKPCAVIFIYSKLRGAPEYYCIPTPDAPEALWDRFRGSLAGDNDNKQEQMQFFSFALAKAFMLCSTQ